MLTGKALGNVRLPKRASGLQEESVVNVSQPITLDKAFLSARVGSMTPSKQQLTR